MSEQQNQQQVQRVITIEICKNCHLHQDTTHHDEQQYIDRFHQMKEVLEQNLPNTTVIQQSISKNQRHLSNILPALGGFEIRYKDILVASKQKSKEFPSPKLVLKKFQEIYEAIEKGESINKHDLTKKVPHSPMVKQRQFYRKPQRRNDHRTNSEKQRSSGVSQIIGRSHPIVFSPEKMKEIQRKMNNNHWVMQSQLKHTQQYGSGKQPIYQVDKSPYDYNLTKSTLYSPELQRSKMEQSGMYSPLKSKDGSLMRPHKSNLEIMKEQVSNPGFRNNFLSKSRHTRVLSCDDDLYSRRLIKGCNFAVIDYQMYFSQVNPQGYQDFQVKKIQEMGHQAGKIGRSLHMRQPLRPEEQDYISMSKTQEFQMQLSQAQ